MTSPLSPIKQANSLQYSFKIVVLGYIAHHSYRLNSLCLFLLVLFIQPIQNYWLSSYGVVGIELDAGRTAVLKTTVFLSSQGQMTNRVIHAPNTIYLL